MPNNILKPETKTIEITNFDGRLTRTRNGTLNSGLAKFDSSFGYNPFFKPGQLSWFKAPFDLSSNISSGVALAGVSRVESGVLVTYIITSTGHLYRLIGEGSGSSDLHTITDNSETYTYGADITFYGAANNLYISHDLGVTKVVLNSSGAYVSNAAVGTWDATHFTPITTRRGMCQFVGNLYIINSDASVTYANNIAEITPSLTITYAKLSPSLPIGSYIRDLDVNPDFTYLLITTSMTASELIAPVNDTGNSSSTNSDLYKWNGIDTGITTGIALPNFSSTALQSFGVKQMMFMYDTFGASLFDTGTKVLTLRNQKSPFPNATASTGNFLSWTCPDFYWNQDTQAGNIFGSLYYYGNLEGEKNGLYRMFRQQSTISGTIYQMPYMAFTTNRYLSVNTSDSPQVDSNGTHIYSFTDYSGSGGSTVFKFYGFYIAPPDDSPSGWTGAIGGVYETQNELFSKKITVKQIRVYCEPTVSNNSFTLDMIGGDGKKVTNGSFSYTWASGTDPTLLQGNLERINFNPNVKDIYSLALRITNVGSANMFVNKIEVDYAQSGQ